MQLWMPLETLVVQVEVTRMMALVPPQQAELLLKVTLVMELVMDSPVANVTLGVRIQTVAVVGRVLLE